jgi:UDP-glucose 4-epimerase
MKRRSLVTGGAGFIGSHIVDKLIELDHEVIVIDNESSDSHEHFYWNKLSQNYKLDIRDYDAIAPLFKGIDYVFHLAAESKIQTAIQNPIATAEVNIIGTNNVLQAARESQCSRVVFSTTSAIYGQINEPPLREEMPRDCLNPYSVTKASGEDLMKMYSNLYGLETVCLRYFNVYGDRQPIRGQYAPVIGIFLRQRRAGQDLTIVGDGTQSRDFVHVSDVATANIYAATSPSISSNLGTVINIGTGTQTSVNEVATIIGGSTKTLPHRPGESSVSVANNYKAFELLGWQPQIELKSWLSSK